MAPARSLAKDISPAVGGFRISKSVFASALLVLDAVLIALIIAYVPYTKIDWDAYMSQVDGFLGGERDYTKLKGDTGPLVYPAGFLYVYSGIKFLTGGEVFPAQILFGILYIINLAVIFFIYIKSDVLPWWAFSLLCLSKRVHSIFVLRLFNDCFAMTLLHASLALVLCQKWHMALIIYSGSVAIKMNVLLYAPPLFLLMLKALDIKGVFSTLFGAALVQIILGLPFLLTYPVEYLSRAFNLGRVFIHFWSVNFKFVPEQIFVSKEFSIALLVLHLMLLATFAQFRWSKSEGLFILLKVKVSDALSSIRRFHSYEPRTKTLNKSYVASVMFTGNFIGIVCARSLHYQFYSWYFYSLPFLLWISPFPTPLRLILFAGVELCWNIYPSNVYSSCLLLFNQKGGAEGSQSMMLQDIINIHHLNYYYYFFL
ncbi:dol-P-Man:Man(5)GlcNAc(2)-PP-Dol alpha-1,3-mannosyltransferase-like isoform X1 [Zingiber officinale]|uniref:dol-P-Man:Man(5)GlcNAc(2)-PP-Dol alpha-1,3-mannosyltransferase-like isoform X1 n=1 Tax=Zingiber officinale TaxID=94328 RepID=UPI001C4BDC75|nr:dol-P-Man:Man(5)GlcNAc(2)-PP-Dol alpha-1,3-mannosyltransferase-like isoform X1 [Zingiber officinale]XP_042464258.1 dol-P-Man:Man(5)GlcNAc(2)-PP-Dol alpha-1,3-mannosyltransferase-like isoform X1 [Zingiber officinale]